MQELIVFFGGKCYSNAILLHRGKYMRFDEIIKNVRHQCLMSQSDFAEAIGVSFSTVNRWENGKTMPNYSAMKKINTYCKGINIPFEISEVIWEEKQWH